MSVFSHLRWHKLIQRKDRQSRLTCVLLMASTFVFPYVGTAQSAQYLPGDVLVAGTGTKSYTGDGGPALSATIANAALAVTTDPQGNVYFADTGNNAVRRIDAGTGIITTIAGLAPGASLCTSKADAIGDGCPGSQASLNAPSGVRVYNGDIYIADTGNNRIRVVNGATGIISVFAGNGSASGVVFGDGQDAATATALGQPADIAFDPNGNAYVITANGKPYILRIDHMTGNVTNVAGNGVAANTGDGGAATSASIQTPTALALDSQNNLYISCATPNTVRRVNLGSGIINTFAGTLNTACATSTDACGDGGLATQAQLNSPDHMVADATDNLYIVDTKDHRIRMVSAATGNIATIAGTGTPSNSLSGVVAINANLNNPRGIDLTPAGDLIFTDGFNAEIKVLAPPAVFPVNFTSTSVGATATQNAWVHINTALTVSSTAPFGVPSAYKSFTSGAPTNCSEGASIAAGTNCYVPVTFTPQAAGFQGAPLQLTDSLGNVYVLPLAGIGNAPAATLLPGIISLTAGSSNGASGNAGDGNAAMAAQLNAPTAIAFDGLGNYFVADTENNEVREITTTGTIIRIAGNGTACSSATSVCGDGGAAIDAQLNAPKGLAVDGSGQVYIADTGDNRVRLLNTAGMISTVVGNGNPGYLGDGAVSTAAELLAPQGLYLTPTGELYIADSGNHVVRIVGTRSGLITTLAGNGIAGYSGDGLESQLAQLNTPEAVVVDNGGNAYIADTGNHLIRRVSRGVISTYAGSSAAGDRDGTAANALFSAPGALAVDAGGSLYVADTANNVIRRISNGVVTTVAGTSTAGSSGNGGSSAAANFSAPAGVGLDNSGNLIISDTANNAIRTVSVSSSALAFPATSPSTTGEPMAVSLLNSGNQPLTVSSVTVPANFTEQTTSETNCNAGSLVLSAGDSCQASFEFSPTAIQNYSGTASISDNSGSQPSAMQTIALTGNGQYVFSVRVSPSLSQVIAGQPFQVAVTVTNPNATYNGTMHFSASDGNAAVILPPDTSFQGSGGSLTFNVTLATAGQQTITVTDTTDKTITESAAITVAAAPASKLVITAGNQQSANLNSNYAQALTVQAMDNYGNASPGASVTFTAPASGATVTFSGSSTSNGVTSSQGLFTSPTMMSDAVTGALSIVAASPGAGSVTFTETNTSTVPASFTLSANPSSIYSLPPGTSTMATVTITPLGGFNAPVNVTCTSPAPLSTCSLSAATVQPSGIGAPVTFMVSIATAGPSTSQLTEHHEVVAFASFFMLGMGTLYRRRKRLRHLALIILCGLALGSLGGCSSGKPAQTVAGNYTATITATSGTMTANLTIPIYVAGAP